MPKALHDKLAREARKKGFKTGSPRFNRYVYGTMNKIEEAQKKTRKKPKTRKTRKRKR